MNFEIKNGNFYYDPAEPILKDISFSVNEHEILSILGPNGIGKTTLLRCTLGFLKWKQGSAFIDGRPFNELSHNEFWKKVSYVPQARTQTFPCTVRETVLMGRSSFLGMFQIPGKKDKQAAEKAMELAGITHLAEKNCSEISGGELQLVLIARALSSEPEFLVMDEPETGLDFRNQLIILEMISKLKKEHGLSVIFNTHYPDHALDISDKTLLLQKNGAALFGKTSEILTSENMQNAFDVNIEIKKYEIDGVPHHSIIPTSLIR